MIYLIQYIAWSISIISNLLNDLSGDRNEGCLHIKSPLRHLLKAADSRTSLNSQHHDAERPRVLMCSHSCSLLRFCQDAQWMSIQLLVCSRTHARTHCIPHAGFARFSLAQLSLINLFERTIVRNATDNPIGRKGPTTSCNARGLHCPIKGKQPSCSRELVLYVFHSPFEFTSSPMVVEKHVSRVCRANPGKLNHTKNYSVLKYFSHI